MSRKTPGTVSTAEAKSALVPKLRFPEFRGAEGWDANPLGDLVDFVNEKIPLEQVALENYVSTENILPDYSGVARASKLPTTGSVTRFRPSDTLVSNIRPYLKKVWIADKEGGASNDVIVIRAKQRLNSTTITRIYGPDLRGLAIKHPEEKAEQQRIADCLSSLDTHITAATQALNTLKTYKQGLMQQLFPSTTGGDAMEGKS